MPRVRRRGHLLRNGLSDLEEMELMIGPCGAFKDDKSRREAWFRHRDELLAMVGPEEGPWGLVQYELGGFQAKETIHRALVRLGIRKPSAVQSSNIERRGGAQTFGRGDEL